MKKKLFILLGCIATFFILDFAIGKFLQRGLDRYFGLNGNSEILLIGHSHLMLSVDKKMLEDSLGVKVSKYCREGVDVITRDRMIDHYLSLPDKDSLKVVIYGVDQYMFNPNGLSDNVYKLFYPFMDNENIDRFIQDNATPKDYWIHKLIRTSGYNDMLINSSLRGWSNNWSNYKNGSINIDALRGENKGKQLRPIIVDEQLKNTFEASIKKLTDRGVNVVLLNTPIVKEYNDYEPEKRAEIIDYFQSLSGSSPLIHYWDLNPKYADHYDIFYDPIHINVEGQPIITNEVINLYRTEFQPNIPPSHSLLSSPTTNNQ